MIQFWKLQTYGIDGNLLMLLKNYLKDQQQWGISNGQISSWKNISAGVPQGSVFGSLMLIIFINDFPEGVTSLCKIY